MSKGRKKLTNPGQRNRFKLVEKKRLPSEIFRGRCNKSKRARVHYRKKYIFTGDVINRSRVEENERRIIEIQNSVSTVNFSIANCNEILSEINGKDRSMRSFADHLRKEIVRYKSLKKRRLQHLYSAMNYTGRRRLPRKRTDSLRINEAFKRRIKLRRRQDRTTRIDLGFSLNINDLQEQVTKLMADDERCVQGLDEIELSDFDDETNEGGNYKLEVMSKRGRRRRNRTIKGKGARGNNVTEMYDEDDIFLEYDNYQSRYQFALDLKFKDRNIGE